MPRGEYIVSVTPLGVTSTQEREPNNDLQRANRLVPPVISGYTSFTGDKDYFLLTYDGRVNERFEVTGVKAGAIRVSITDPLGYIIKSVDVRGDRTVLLNETIDRKGYVIVESVSEDYDNPYTVKLRGGQ